MQTKRIGELLMERGLLNEAQVEEILVRQKENHQPFGQLAAAIFGIDEFELWHAWARQIIHYCPQIDVAAAEVHPEALLAISRQDAWTHRILPLQTDGERLICATSYDRLPDAMAFLMTRCQYSAEFKIAAPEELEHMILRHYAPEHSRMG